MKVQTKLKCIQDQSVKLAEDEAEEIATACHNIRSKFSKRTKTMMDTGIEGLGDEEDQDQESCG